MLKLILYNNDNIEINKIYKKQFDTELKYNKNIVIYSLYNNNKFVGYTMYKILKNYTIKIDWIYAPGYGKEFMKKLERKFKKMNIKKIILNVSIDPTENKEIVMKRLNFYIRLQYKVYNIEFRKDYGPLLNMYKML